MKEHERTAWHSRVSLQLEEHIGKASSVDDAVIRSLEDYWGKVESDISSSPYLPAQPGGAGRQSPPEDDAAEVLRPNIIYPHIISMVSAIVPSVPKVSMEPDLYSDDPKEAEAMTVAARAREARIHKVFRVNTLGKKLRRGAALAALSGYAGGRVWYNAKRKRIEINIVPRTRFWFDTTVDEWDDVRYVIWSSVARTEEFQASARAFKAKAEKNPDIWVRSDIDSIIEHGTGPDSIPTTRDDNRFGGGSAITDTETVTVRYDYYDFVKKRWLVFVRGDTTPVMDAPLPYKFVENNFFLISLVDNLVTLTGLPDSQVIEQTLAAKGEADSLGFMQMKANIPHLFINKRVVKNADDIVSAFRSAAGPSAFALEIEGTGTRMEDAISWSRGPSVMADTYKMSDRMSLEIQRLTATPDVARGLIGGAEIATEVAVADALRREQQTPRVDEIMLVIAHIARTIIRLDAEFFPVKGHMLLRSDSSEPPQKVSRETMRLPQPKKVEKGTEPTWGDLAWEDEYDVTPIPYSGAETHSLARGNAIISRYPFLKDNVYIDQRILTAAIVAGTSRPDMLLSEEQMQEKAQAAAAQAAGAGGAGGLLGGGGPLGAPPGLLPAATGTPPGILEPRAPGQDGVATGALALGGEPPSMGGMAGGAGFPAPMPGIPK